MPDPIEQLTSALADHYRIEREVGQGGMATVYLAQDLKHNRQVAVKVLRPDLAATLGPDRFLREIEIAAQLHHPHIMPLYDSGEADGFLYYVMPYEQGQSLRERLTRQGELPIAEVVRLLEHVVDALAHAHEYGVVHRDIKPENIMLSGQHAIVTDFGVAKAVSEATGRQQLTTAGVALGTPSYMAPEQASADPNIDQRADIYAIGIVAYELLTGQPPFTGNTAQAVLAAHLTQKPEPVSTHRDTVPPALEALVMRCLEKKAADRWQSANELGAQLRALGATSSVGITPTAGVEPVKRWSPVAKVGIVVAALVVLAGAYGTMQFGKVGRAGTLIGRDLLAKDDLILVAEFEDRTDDATLGQTITDAVRVELQQSPVVEVLSQAGMWDGMRRMGLDIGTALPDSQVRELAERENAKAYVAGEVSQLGAGYQITARVIATADGTEALTVRVTAANDDELIGALEELGLQLRRDIGESLRSVRSAPPLSQVTTSSLPALRALMAGSRAERGGDRPRAITLIEEALRLDSTFATAWRSLAVMHVNSNRYREATDAIARAYVFRDRLPERERLGVTSMYHSLRSEYDLAEVAERQLIDLEPDDPFGYVGLSNVLLKVHRWPEAEAAALEGVEKDSSEQIAYWNAVEAQIAQGRFDAADSTLALMAPYFPDGAWHREMVQSNLLAQRDLEALRLFHDSLGAEGILQQDVQAQFSQCLSFFYRGRLTEARQCSTLFPFPQMLFPRLRYLSDTTGVLRGIELGRTAMVEGQDTEAVAFFVALLAEMGQTSEAQALLDEWRDLVGADDPVFLVYHNYAEGAIALADGDFDSAAQAFLAFNRSGYPTSLHLFNRGFSEAANAMDRAGRPDSAIALYERALAQPSIYAGNYEVRWYPFALRRLGELYEARGDRDQAVDYYQRFIDLWRDADAELQPQVDDARQRLVGLVGERG